nr:LysR family transcriptional regulator [Microlunatus panaciterrae]
MEHFIAVAEEQHFTHAAELLQISQSGLSASIRALETELGSPLFVRSTRRVELTPAGRAFLDEAVRTVASATAAKNAVAAVQGVLRGTMSVGTEQCLGVLNLPQELAGFRSRHPGVEVRLSYEGSADLVAKVGAGQVDLALVAICDPDPIGLQLVPLSVESFVVLCHPSHPVAALTSVEIDRLVGESFVGFLPGWGARVLAERAFASIGSPHRVSMEVNDVHTLLDLVEHGLGIAIVPEHFARKRPDKLAAVAIDHDRLQWRVAVALPHQPSPAAKELLSQFDVSAQSAPTAAA